MVSCQQIAAAKNIATVFAEKKIRYALLKAECQAGKTGAFQTLISEMLRSGEIQCAYILCGFSRMLEGLANDPEFVHAVFRKITEIIKVSLDQYLSQVGPYIEVVKMGDDLGGQDNSLMSPATYRKTIKPYHQELFRFIKARTPARVFLHSCGAIYKLLPDLIDAGVEVLNPVQVSARGMSPENLKGKHGKDFTFHGAIDTQHVMPEGNAEDVRAEVDRVIRVLGKSGGYILAGSQAFENDIPLENIVIMYDEAQRVRV